MILLLYKRNLWLNARDSSACISPLQCNFFVLFLILVFLCLTVYSNVVYVEIMYVFYSLLRMHKKKMGEKADR